MASEHDPEKWTPVFRKDHAPTKKLVAPNLKNSAFSLSLVRLPLEMIRCGQQQNAVTFTHAIERFEPIGA